MKLVIIKNNPDLVGVVLFFSARIQIYPIMNMSEWLRAEGGDDWAKPGVTEREFLRATALGWLVPGVAVLAVGRHLSGEPTLLGHALGHVRFVPPSVFDSGEVSLPHGAGATLLLLGTSRHETVAVRDLLGRKLLRHDFSPRRVCCINGICTTPISYLKLTGKRESQ